MALKLIRLHAKLAVLQAADSHRQFTPIVFYRGFIFIKR